MSLLLDWVAMTESPKKCKKTQLWNFWGVKMAIGTLIMLIYEDLHYDTSVIRTTFPFSTFIGKSCFLNNRPLKVCMLKYSEVVRIRQALVT